MVSAGKKAEVKNDARGGGNIFFHIMVTVVDKSDICPSVFIQKRFRLTESLVLNVKGENMAAKAREKESVAAFSGGGVNCRVGRI